MENKQKVIRAGQYWYVDLSPVIGEEIGGYRKCLVVRKHHNLVRVRPLIYNGVYLTIPNGTKELLMYHD